jgi:hypothetical protein
MFTSCSSPYLQAVVQVALNQSALASIHKDIQAEPGFLNDLAYVQSILSKDTVTVSYVLGQGSRVGSPTLQGYSVLYK